VVFEYSAIFRHRAWASRHVSVDSASPGTRERIDVRQRPSRGVGTSSRKSIHRWVHLNDTVVRLTDRETPSHTTFIDGAVVQCGMHAVSSSASRIGGQTSVIAASAFNFGKFTRKLTARGPNRTNGWDGYGSPRSVRDRPPYSPPASGHGHRR